MADPVSIIWNVFKAARFIYTAVESAQAMDGEVTTLKLQVSEVTKKMVLLSGGTVTEDMDPKTDKGPTQEAKDAQEAELERQKINVKDFQANLTTLATQVENAKKFIEKNNVGNKKSFFASLTATKNLKTLTKHIATMAAQLGLFTSVLQTINAAELGEVKAIAGIANMKSKLETTAKADYTQKEVRNNNVCACTCDGRAVLVRARARVCVCNVQCAMCNVRQ